VAWEPDGDLKRDEVTFIIHLVNKESWNQALSVEHRHSEQAVVAILPATGVEVKLMQRGSSKILSNTNLLKVGVLAAVLHTYKCKLLSQNRQGFLVPV